MSRRLDSFLDALARGKRPRRRPLTDDEARAAMTAASLRAARPEASTPDPDFVDSLARRLRQEPEASTSNGRGWHRREFIAAAAGVAAAAAGGATVERLLNPSQTPQQASTTDWSETLIPDSGTWQQVGSTSALNKNATLAFQQSGVSGFVSLLNGKLTAVSAICTHLGCTLQHYSDDNLLHCPCHTQTSFALDGSLKTSAYTLPPLPKLQVRANGDRVEVLLPKES